MRVFQANFNGDFLGAFETPGGEWSWAAGYERRSEKAQSLPDGGSALGAVYFTPGNVTEGDLLGSTKLYGELGMPLLADMPLVHHALTAEVSFRWSDYDFVSKDTTNWKFARRVGADPGSCVSATPTPTACVPRTSPSGSWVSRRRLRATPIPVTTGIPLATPPSSPTVAPGGDNLPAGFMVRRPAGDHHRRR